MVVSLPPVLPFAWQSSRNAVRGGFVPVVPWDRADRVPVGCGGGGNGMVAGTNEHEAGYGRGKLWSGYSRRPDRQAMWRWGGGGKLFCATAEIKLEFS